MYEIPQTLAAAQTLAQDRQMSVTAVIQQGLQNWAQELLAEGFEGNYYTAKFTPTGLQITAITGDQVYVATDIQADDFVHRFKTADHATLLLLQTKIRTLIDQHQLN